MRFFPAKVRHSVLLHRRFRVIWATSSSGKRSALLAPVCSLLGLRSLDTAL
jgi:hypothetical protein